MRLFATYLIFLSKFAFITYGAMLPHQGRVLISGSAFEGTGLFRFALVDQSGAVVWNHEGGVGDPQNSLSIPVEKGFYQCRLGDTSTQGMAPLPDTIFTPENQLKLRIWFDDGTNGLQRLGQDQNLMMAPYAMTSPRTESEKIAMRFADEIIRQAGTSNISVDELIERISSFAQQATKQGTITKEMLPADIFAEMNQTIQMFHNSQSMIADLNRTLNQAVIAFNRPITTSMLSEDIIKYLRPEIISQTTLNSLGYVYQGKNINLTLGAEGKFITYQWQKDGVDIQGETASNLNLGSFTPLTQNGTYRAIVANDFGSVLTEPVTLFFPVSPEDLNSTAPLTIRENLPAGTLVGQFTANDPDDGNLTFNLEDGESPDHAFFRLESNGTLFTSTTFDFENNKSSYSLMVGVNDQDGGVAYGFFTVILVDEDDQPNQAATHTVDLNSSVNLEMIWVEPGTFMMGSPTTEAGRSTDETQREVTLTKGFYLGKYEVTQDQYEAVMTGNTNSLSPTPSEWPNNPNRPVERVSWNDAQIFLSRLNAQQSANIPAGWAYVLPTEAQWEYACRAGTTTAYSWGDSITSSNANYNSSGLSQTRDVGNYASNPWGFYDMHGNVFEWVADRFGWYDSNAVTDPIGPASGSTRVLRSGSWINAGENLRSAYRFNLFSPSFRDFSVGFRVGFQKQ